MFKASQHQLNKLQTLESYEGLVKSLTTKLNDAEIRRYIGEKFKSLFEEHVTAFEACIHTHTGRRWFCTANG